MVGPAVSEPESTDNSESAIVESEPAQPEEGKESKPVQSIKLFESRLTPRIFSLYNPEADILDEQNSEFLKEYAEACPDIDELMTQDGKPTQKLIDRV